MVREEPSWFTDSKGPLRDGQPPNASFSNKKSYYRTAQTIAPNNRPRKNIRYDPVPSTPTGQQHNVNRAQPFAFPAPQQFEAPDGRSRLTDWNATRPQVLFHSHTDILLKHEYKRGMIINAPVHEPGTYKNISKAATINDSTSAWGLVFTKPRYMIVVGLHQTHYKAIPVYTHEGKGIQGKEHYKNEFISIRDSRIRGEFKALTDYKELVTEGKGGALIDRVSLAWIAHPVERSYDLNLSRAGMLTDESTSRLCRFVDAESKRGLGLA